MNLGEEVNLCNRIKAAPNFVGCFAIKLPLLQNRMELGEEIQLWRNTGSELGGRLQKGKSIVVFTMVGMLNLYYIRLLEKLWT